MKLFVLLALALVFLGAVFASVSHPLSLLSPTADPQPLNARVVVHTVDSEKIIITGLINVDYFNRKWKTDLVVDFQGLENSKIEQIDFHRTTTQASATSRLESTWTDPVKFTKNQIKATGIAWPEFPNATARSFQLVIKIGDKVASTGFKIKPSSYFSAENGTLKQTFADAPSTVLPSFGKLVTSFKPKETRSVFDPKLADVEFTIKNLNIPENAVSNAGLSLIDFLGNAKFNGPDTATCSVGGTDVQVQRTNGFITFKDIKPFTGVPSVRVVCQDKLQVNFGKDAELPHVWTMSFMDDNSNKNYIAQHIQVEMLNNGFVLTQTAIIIIAVCLALALILLVIIGLKIAKVGPFKPKKDQMDTGLLADHDGYSTY